MPVEVPIVAEPGLLLIHPPPLVELVSADVPPRHTFLLPLIVAGSGKTVNVVIVRHPVEVSI